MKVKIAMFEAASVYVRVTLTAARSSLIKCLHCDDMRADWRQARNGAISRSPCRIISHGLIRKQTLSTVYKFQSTMGEMIRKARHLL